MLSIERQVKNLPEQARDRLLEEIKIQRGVCVLVGRGYNKTLCQQTLTLLQGGKIPHYRSSPQHGKVVIRRMKGADYEDWPA